MVSACWTLRPNGSSLSPAPSSSPPSPSTNSSVERSEEKPMGRLQGKIAVVTGAADGIGHAITEAMAAEGAHVFASDINDQKGEAFVAELRGKGQAADYV